MESPTKCWCEQYSWNLFGYKTTPSHFESLGKCYNNEIWGGGSFSFNRYINSFWPQGIYIVENFLTVRYVSEVRTRNMKSYATPLPSPQIISPIDANDVPYLPPTENRQKRGEGESLPCPFLKIGKSAPILEKQVLIAVILGLNFPFKILF